MSQLSTEQINEYIETGVLVVDNVFSDSEIEEIRSNFHNQLSKMGINHHAILEGKEEIKDGIRIKSPISRIFYAKWKLNCHLNPKVLKIADELMSHTYNAPINIRNELGFNHPFKIQNSKVLAYIDRVCWRLPDSIRSEGGLALHMDRNPYDPFLEKSGTLKKWRPIQAFITLTDHYGSESGGLQVIKGFHKEIDNYFKNSDKDKEINGGEFFRMNNYIELNRRLETIYAPKGSLVFWDNRLPHATSDKLISNDTREVIYTGFLPDTTLNRSYIAKQRLALEKNFPPPAYVESNPKETVDRDWLFTEFSDDQLNRLGFETYDIND